MLTRGLATLVLASALVACSGSDSPTAPSPTPTAPTPPAPTIQRFTLTGVVTNLETRGPVVGGNVLVTSSATQTNASATTDGSGYYSIDGVGAGGPTTIRFTADRYNGLQQTNVSLTMHERRDVAIAPYFRRTGTGNTVFDMPTYVQRVRVVGVYNSFCSNFVIRIAGRLLVNEILGTCGSAVGPRYEGLHLTNGGVVEITISSGVQWELSQEQ